MNSFILLRTSLNELNNVFFSMQPAAVHSVLNK